jgi:hypothetical protein
MVCSGGTNKVEMVELLLRWGAYPLAKSKRGETPFDMASSEEIKERLQKWIYFRYEKILLH